MPGRSSLKICISDHKPRYNYYTHVSLFAMAARELRISFYSQFHK